MSLTPLTDRDEIRQSFETTVSNLQDGATAVKRKGSSIKNRKASFGASLSRLGRDIQPLRLLSSPQQSSPE